MEHKDILARAAKVADSAEIYSTRSQSIRVGFENNFIKESSSSDLSATGVRVIKDGRIGFSSSSKPGDGSIADMAADLSQFGKPVKFAFPGPGTVQHLPPDSAGSPPSESDAVSTCEGAVDSLRSLGDGIMAFSGISSHEVTGKLVNTAGFEGEQSHSRISSYCGLVQNKEGNFLQLFESKVSRSFGGFGPMISKVSEDFRLCATNEKLTTRKYRVLFTPRGFSHLLGVFSACLNGFAVGKHISPWSKRLGEKLFDERVTMYTDTVSSEALLRLAFDAEGVPCSKAVLIDRGVLKSFYHSLDTAAECGHEPTGHGFRDGGSLPSPSLQCMGFAPGAGHLDAMAADAEIWIDDLIGTSMCNPYTGNISGNVAMGFTIENGRRRARVKDAMLNVRVFDELKSSVLAVSAETDVIGYTRLPYVLLDGITIAAQ